MLFQLSKQCFSRVQLATCYMSHIWANWLFVVCMCDFPFGHSRPCFPTAAGVLLQLLEGNTDVDLKPVTLIHCVWTPVAVSVMAIVHLQSWWLYYAFLHLPQLNPHAWT